VRTPRIRLLSLQSGPAAKGIRDAMEHLQIFRERPPAEFVATFEDRLLDPEWRAGAVLPNVACPFR
jgi:hypothetical protein